MKNIKGVDVFMVLVLIVTVLSLLRGNTSAITNYIDLVILFTGIGYFFLRITGKDK